MRAHGVAGNIEPFYFGSQALFGCYHAPGSRHQRDGGVVLCYPMGDEYIRFHRAFRQLADRLAAVGFPVLRFDFYVCGDSAGACEEAEMRQWLTDLATAVREIRRRGGVAQVCLVGLWLGGALAMLAGAARGGIDGMVLWDPVISGQVYIEELIGSHEAMLRRAHVQPKRRRAGDMPAEILGFPLPHGLWTELQKVDLLAVRQKPANHILVIESTEAAAKDGGLRGHLYRTGAEVALQHLPHPQLWMWTENIAKIRVPHPILQAVVAWITEVYR